MSLFPFRFLFQKIILHTIVFLLLGFSLWATETKNKTDFPWQDIKRVSRYSSYIKSNQLSSVTKKISSIKKPLYTESFLAGVSYQKKNLCSYAIRWFARSVYVSSMPMPESYSFSVIQKYLEKNKEHSFVQQHALLRITSCYLSMNMLSPVEALLPQLDKTTGKRFAKDVLILKTKFFERKGNIGEAEKVWLQIGKEYISPNTFLSIGDFYRRRRNFQEALKFYFKALEFPQNDSTYVAAVGRVNITPHQELSDYQKVRMAEGYRILKKPEDSLLLWKQISVQKLDEKGLLYYTKNYARLLIQLRSFYEAEKLVKRYRNKLSIEKQEELLSDIALRLYKSQRYQSILRVIPSSSTYGQATYYRLLVLNKMKIQGRKKEIINFAKESKKTIQQAKELLFQVCLDTHAQKKYEEALSCYDETIHLKFPENKKKINSQSKESYNGKIQPQNAQALYFKALLLEQKKDKNAAKVFREVYTQSGAGFYTFKALAKGGEKNDLYLPGLIPRENSNSKNNNADETSEEKKFALVLNEKITTNERNEDIRHWLSFNANDPQKLSLFFTAKKNIEGYAVDPFWYEWKEKFSHFSNSVSLDQRMAILYYVMGYKQTAIYFLGEKIDKPTRYLIFQKIGQLEEDVGLSSWSMRAYARTQNKKIDVFFLNQEAASLLYPTPYLKDVKKVAEKTGLGSAEIYALMKQESNYRADAKSSAGAKGLMQLMPSTARWLNKKLKISHLDLFKPEHNIMLGAVFFHDLLKRNKDDFEAAAIAYNAGPGRLAQWRSLYKDYTNEMLYEKIPIKETYYYLRVTRENFDNYATMLKYNFGVFHKDKK